LQTIELTSSSLRQPSTPDGTPVPANGGTFDLNIPGGRRRVYGVLISFLFVLAWLMQGAKSHKSHEALDFVVSDAEGYWVYMPSVVLDGNLDFRREIFWHATVHSIEPTDFPQTPLGLRNHWPTGVAVTLAPAFLTAHVLAVALHHFTHSSLVTPNGYSIIYQFACLSMVMLLGFATLVAADDVLVRSFHIPGPAIAYGVVVYAIGSSWAYYIFREPFMAHAVSAAWVMFTILLAERITSAAAERSVVWWHWPAMIFALSMAIICRPSNAVIFIIVAWSLLITLRAGLLGRFLKLLPLMILAAFPIVLQLITWHILARRNAATGGGLAGYGAHEVFHWFHPALWQTLFSSNHGIFFWSPVLLLGVWGYARRLTQAGGLRDGFIICLLLTFAALWYINSAWYAWWFGKSFGARSFVDMSGIFIIGMAFGFDWLLSLSPGWRRAAKAGVWAGLIFNWLLLAAFVAYLIPRQSPLFGVHRVDENNPAALLSPMPPGS
jgi:hypothetical protein